MGADGGFWNRNGLAAGLLHYLHRALGPDRRPAHSVERGGGAVTSELTAERLRELLRYEPETGEFHWRGGGGRPRKKTTAGCPDKDGYVRIKVDQRLYAAHRLAWLYVHGKWPDYTIDHMNCIRNDNMIANLRDIPREANMQNLQSAGAANKSSGLLGVSWHKGSKDWRANIKVSGKKLSLGRFNSAESAHAAYLKAKAQLHPYSINAMGEP